LSSIGKTPFVDVIDHLDFFGKHLFLLLLYRTNWLLEYLKYNLCTSDWFGLWYYLDFQLY